MLSCWNADPLLRPSFTDLHNFLSEVPDHYPKRSADSGVATRESTDSNPDVYVVGVYKEVRLIFTLSTCITRALAGRPGL